MLLVAADRSSSEDNTLRTSGFADDDNKYHLAINMS